MRESRAIDSPARVAWHPMAPIVAADYDAAARLALIVEAEGGMASAKAVEEEDVLVINDVDASKKCKEAGGAQDSIDVDDDDDDCIDVVVGLTESPPPLPPTDSS